MYINVIHSRPMHHQWRAVRSRPPQRRHVLSGMSHDTHASARRSGAWGDNGETLVSPGINGNALQQPWQPAPGPYHEALLQRRHLLPEACCLSRGRRMLRLQRLVRRSQARPLGSGAGFMGKAIAAAKWAAADRQLLRTPQTAHMHAIPTCAIVGM